MKYQVGDLIDDYDNAGLGYIEALTEHPCNNIITIHIVWFSDLAKYVYTDYSVNSWIVNKTAIHYPVGNQ